ncbi:histidine kinase [Nostoc sp. CMAA1605]|nr:histidine kinase [Nostoc sp. CMAA1605]
MWRRQGRQGRNEKFFSPCPMPHAPCPMPHAPCPMPHAPFHY